MDPATFPEHETFIRHRIESGQNRDASDVIREALQLLSERDRDRAELRAALTIGLDQIERGETVLWTSDFLSHLSEEVLDEMASETPASPQTTR